MKKLIIILLIAAAGGLAASYYHAHPVTVSIQPKAPATPTPPPVKKWTPDDIAKDPQGYLAYCDQQVQAQIAERQRRLASLSATRQDVATRQQALSDKMAEVVNFRTRLQTAYDHAADEDRWPVRMAGRTFERDKANDLLTQTQSWLDDRQPLADAYAASLKKMDDSAAAYNGDLANLDQLREKIGLDLERVKLNQGMAELDSLQKTQTQLSSMSATLSKMSDEQAPVLSTASKTSHVDIDSLLK